MTKTKLTPSLFYEHVTEYLHIYLPKQIACSPHTIRSYQQGLNQFRRYMEKEHGQRLSQLALSMITREVVLAYLHWLIEKKGCSPSTRNQRLASLKSFLKFASDKDLGFVSTYLMIQKIPSMKAPKFRVQWIPEVAIHAILKQPDQSSRGIRDRMLMIMLYDTGARLSEILLLKRKDLDLITTEPYVWLHGKGNKQRIVPLMDKTVRLLKSYIELFHPNDSNSEAFLFYTTIKGAQHQMCPDTVERLVQKYGHKAQKQCAQVPDRVYPHLFRHSRASHLYRSGIPLPVISRFLGHAHLSTTDIYASADLDMIRASLEKLQSKGEKPIQPLWRDNDEMIAKLCGLT
jgi:integrase/recombinase XerD